MMSATIAPQRLPSARNGATRAGVIGAFTATSRGSTTIGTPLPNTTSAACGST